MPKGGTGAGHRHGHEYQPVVRSEANRHVPHGQARHACRKHQADLAPVHVREDPRRNVHGAHRGGASSLDTAYRDVAKAETLLQVRQQYDDALLIEVLDGVTCRQAN